MAKSRAKKSEPKAKEQTKKNEPLSPQKVHELLGLPGPYEPPPPPIPTKGYVTFWDPGSSIQALVKKHPTLFYIPRLFEGERFAKDSDSWRWKQMNLTITGLNEPFDPKSTPPTARELVMYLTLHFLTTGERLDLGRLRTKDLAAGGRRMTVWLSPMGFDLASVSDEWKSPGIATCSLLTPQVKKK